MLATMHPQHNSCYDIMYVPPSGHHCIGHHHYTTKIHRDPGLHLRLEIFTHRFPCYIGVKNQSDFVPLCENNQGNFTIADYSFSVLELLSRNQQLQQQQQQQQQLNFGFATYGNSPSSPFCPPPPPTSALNLILFTALTVLSLD